MSKRLGIRVPLMPLNKILMCSTLNIYFKAVSLIIKVLIFKNGAFAP